MSPTHNPYTQALADFSAHTRYQDLTEATVKATKRLILDTLGCAVGGAQAESSRIIAKVFAAQGGAQESTVLGSGGKLPATRGAYVNAYAANALDADDDLHYKAHIAAATIPPALAVAERQGASGKDFIVATTIGYDVAARIGMSLKGLIISPQGELKFAPVTGYSWCGLAAGVSAGCLLGLDAERMRHTIAITAVSIPLPSSTQHSERAGRAMTKYAMYGTMSEAGVTAALLAEQGFTGLPGVLDGDKGLWRPLGSIDCDFAAMTERLGARWFVEETSYKIYPACRFTNAATDLYYELAARHALQAHEIDRIEVGLIAPALAKHIDDPTYETLVDGQFNMAYVLAVAALGVVPGPSWHAPDTRARADVRAFSRKVFTALEPASSAVTAEDIRRYGHARRLPASIKIFARGQVFEGRAEWSKGDVYTSETALTDADLEKKFRNFCAETLSVAQIEAAIETVWDLENQPNLDGLIRSLVREVASLARNKRTRSLNIGRKGARSNSSKTHTL